MSDHDCFTLPAMAAGGFEQKPATKRDLAETSEGLMTEIHAVEADLKADLRKVETNLTNEMKKGFNNLREILKGPYGLAERLEKVEERVGLR